MTKPCPRCGHAESAMIHPGVGICAKCHLVWLPAGLFEPGSYRQLSDVAKRLGPLCPPDLQHLQAVRRN